MIRALAIGLVGALLVGACATKKTGSRFVFLKPEMTADAFSADFSECEAFSEDKAQFLLDRGKISNSGILLFEYQRKDARTYNEARLLEECMFFRAYTLIKMVDGIGTNPRTDNDRYDKRQGALDLMESGEAKELMDWEFADSIGSRERLESYLQDYPDGHFVDDARERLAGEGEKKKPTTK